MPWPRLQLWDWAAAEELGGCSTLKLLFFNLAVIDLKWDIPEWS